MANETFPPVDWLWRYYRKNAAWYAGDVRAMRQEADRHSFWQSDEQIRLHVPMAADLASMSAGMIFSDSPVITAEDERTDARIQEIMLEAGIYAVLLQAAELASVYGGVFLKLTWDAREACPKLSAVPADAGFPQWRGGILRDITFWNVVREEDGVIWRLEERYTGDGCIYSRLLKGGEDHLGEEAGMNTIPETKEIRPVVRSGTNRLLAVYVPNMLPNRIRPYLRFGRSDFDGLYGLFDELDEAYSAIQRETRMTKTTVIVPMEYLRRKEALFEEIDNNAKAVEWTFSNATGAFTALDIATNGDSVPITIVNPEIRAESRIAVCDDLVRRILSLAGYAPQSAGLDITGSAESGTALTVRERKSLRTTETKKTYWWHAIKDIMTSMLALDAAVFRSGVRADSNLTVEMPSNTQPDIAQMAEILEQLERAGAISVEGKVRLLHPDWSEDKILAEVAAIREERGQTGETPLDAALGDREAEAE